MNMLYDSDNYVVVGIDANAVPEGEPARPARNGFEVVDKRTNRFVYLDGAFAEAFRDHLKRWQEKTPEQREVEEVLHGYAEVMHNPLCIH